jgi:hypothetical protein
VPHDSTAGNSDDAYDREDRHRRRMQRKKAVIDAGIERAGVRAQKGLAL